MANIIDDWLYSRREELERNQLSIEGTGGGHWRIGQPKPVERTIWKIQKLIEERGLSKGVLRIRPGGVLEVATDEICVRDLYREALVEIFVHEPTVHKILELIEERGLSDIRLDFYNVQAMENATVKIFGRNLYREIFNEIYNQGYEYSEELNYMPLAIELYKQAIAEHTQPNTRQWLEELSNAPALWDGLLYDHFDSHHGGFVLRYADNPDGDTIETASVLQPFNSRFDWALIELTRRALPKGENERLNQSIFDTLAAHGIKHKIVVGHWDNYAYPYMGVRFCFIERPEDMPLDAFRRLVTDCVTEDKTRNTCAVINQLHTEENSESLHYASDVFYKSNYAVMPDGKIQPYDSTHFADIYARLKAGGSFAKFVGVCCKFVIDGPESSYCPFIKY